MKTLGIIGGIGPESTIEYYRAIITAYRERREDSDYPSIIINSISVNKLLGLMNAKDLPAPTSGCSPPTHRISFSTTCSSVRRFRC